MMITPSILIPLLAACGCLFAWRRSGVQAWLAAVATGAMLIHAVVLLLHVREHGMVVLHVGGWTAPIGITFAVDLFSAIMVALAGIIGFAVVITSIATLDRRRPRHGYYMLVLALLVAVNGAFMTGDLFNLYVWFELMLLSSFVLLTLGGDQPQLEGAIKYVTLSLLSSMLFLASVGLIYATTGTLNMAHLAVRLDGLENPAMATLAGSLLLVAFGIKAAVFPFFFWLPASYHTPPAPVSALFAGLLTKVGVYALIRAVMLIFDQDWLVMSQVILAIAAVTMVTGVLGAVAQNEMRRILSFHIVSQIGYMLMGLGVAISVLGRLGVIDSPEALPASLELSRSVAVIALAGSIFYIFHHILVKTNLFLVSNAVNYDRGTLELKQLGGMMITHPLLAGLFLISALSLAGIPILSGFWAKLTLVRGGLEARTYGIVGIALAVSVLTLLSMAKIWAEVFWKAPPEIDVRKHDRYPDARRRRVMMMAPIIGLAAVTVAIGVGAGPAYELASEAARQLIDSQAYIEAVLPAEVLANEEAAR